MLFYPVYSDVPEAAIDELVCSQVAARLVTASCTGVPHIGLYPFIVDGPVAEVHLANGDEQLADLQSNSECLLDIDEPLATIPSHWEDPDSALFADVYHRTVSLHGTATIGTDEELEAHLGRLLVRYQPEGRYMALHLAWEHYRPHFKRIALVRIAIRERRVKFKLGQKRPREARENIARRLLERGTPLDLRTADIVRQSLGWGL